MTECLSSKPECLALIWVIKPCACPCILLALCLLWYVCICAKVLVSHRRSHKRGSDPEKGAGAFADKLQGKHSSTYFQLHLVPEESVHGAGQLLPGSCKFEATVYYFQPCRDTLSMLTAPLCGCLFVRPCVYVEVLQTQSAERWQSPGNKPQQVYGYRQSRLFGWAHWLDFMTLSRMSLLTSAHLIRKSILTLKKDLAF